MATSRRLGLCSALLLTAALSTGCNLMALPFFLLPGFEPKHDAKFKLAAADKEQEVKVVILSSSGLETRPEFLRVDRDLASMLAMHLREGFKKNKEKVTVVPTSKVENYKDTHPNWRQLDPQEIGRHFEADYVIDLEINKITLFEPGSANTLYHGNAEVAIKVVKTEQGAENPAYVEEYQTNWPRARGPIPADNNNAAGFRQRFLDVVAREISWRFTAHLVEDDFKCD